MSNTILAAQTAAALVEFYVSVKKPVTVSASGLAPAEVVAVEHKRGASWYAATDYTDSSEIQLTDTATMVRVTGPGQYRLNKPITAGSVGLYLDK